MAGVLQQLHLPPLAFLFMVNIILLLLGCVLDASTIILVILPLFIPTCRALGIDLVHFGVVAVVNCMIGLITPPYGVVLFVLNAVTGIPLRDHHRRHLAVRRHADAGAAAAHPVSRIVLWLPHLFGYKGAI